MGVKEVVGTVGTGPGGSKCGSGSSRIRGGRGRSEERGGIVAGK